MQILGISLILGVVALLFLYFKWSKKEAITESLGSEQKITIKVSGAYSPNVIHAELGKPILIIFDRQENNSCSKEVIFSDFGIKQELKDFGKTELKFTPSKKGEFTFSCPMGMYQGKLIVED